MEFLRIRLDYSVLVLLLALIVVMTSLSSISYLSIQLDRIACPSRHRQFDRIRSSIDGERFLFNISPLTAPGCSWLPCKRASRQSSSVPVAPSLSLAADSPRLALSRRLCPVRRTVPSALSPLPSAGSGPPMPPKKSTVAVSKTLSFAATKASTTAAAAQAKAGKPLSAAAKRERQLADEQDRSKALVIDSSEFREAFKVAKEEMGRTSWVPPPNRSRNEWRDSMD